MSIKQLMLGTSIGRILMTWRNRIDLFEAGVRHPEQLEAIVNDQLATELVTRICQPGQTFLDIGAHIGSVMAAVRRHTDCKIVAVEAMGEKAAALQRKFPEATVHACAVGDRDGEASFFVDHAASGYSSLGSHRSNTEEIRVPIRRIDSLVPQDDVDVVKIDVEGAELGVLRGAEVLVSRCRPVVMFESGPEDSIRSRLDLWCWLSDRNYVVLVPSRVAHDGPALTSDGFEESHWYPRRTTNYFAIPAERLMSVRQRARRILGVHPDPSKVPEHESV